MQLTIDNDSIDNGQWTIDNCRAAWKRFHKAVNVGATGLVARSNATHPQSNRIRLSKRQHIPDFNIKFSRFAVFR